MTKKLLIPEEGTAFGAWILLGQGRRPAKWLCVCICGTVRDVQTYDLRKGTSKSCGCLLPGGPKTHGRSSHTDKVYRLWCNIKKRCGNPRDTAYKNYGALGIRMHPGWINNFEAFAAHVGEPPSPGHTLERIKNKKGYVPGNVKWATRAEQSLNTRRNRQITFQGRTAPLVVWCRELNLNYFLVHQRLSRGWPAVRAFNSPKGTS